MQWTLWKLHRICGSRACVNVTRGRHVRQAVNGFLRRAVACKCNQEACELAHNQTLNLTLTKASGYNNIQMPF